MSGILFAGAMDAMKQGHYGEAMMQLGMAAGGALRGKATQTGAVAG